MPADSAVSGYDSPQTRLQRIEQLLPGATLRGDNLRAPCPAHHGDDPNMSLKVQDDGISAVCWSKECPAADIAAAITRITGVTLNPHFGANFSPTSPPIAVYRRADGKCKTVYRIDHDPAVTPCDKGAKCDGKHIWSKGKVRGYLLLLWPPPQPAANAAAVGIVITEGEKAAAAVQAAGYTAASYVSGAKAAGLADYSPVSGCPVTVWPDDDAEGRGAAAKAAAAAYAAGATSVRMMDAPGESKSDAADYEPDIRAALLTAAISRPDWTPPPPDKGRASVPDADDDALEHLRDCTRMENRHITALAVRLITDHPDTLVIATDRKTAEIYRAAADTGLLSRAAGDVGPLAFHTLGLLAADGKGLEGKAWAGYAAYIRKLGEPRIMAEIEAATPAAIALVTEAGFKDRLPEIHDYEEMDAEAHLWGCANGVVDVSALRRLPPDEARRKLVTANTGVAFNPDAFHPAVDLILPPIMESNDITKYYGWAVTHHPKRDAAAEVSEPNSGKTTRRQAFRAALGTEYVKEIRPEALQVQRNNAGGTAHNGDLLAFRKPAKLVFCPDMRGKIDVRLCNHYTGERTARVRDVAEKTVVITVTGHLVMQANDGSEDAPIIGAGDTTSAGEAWRDRLRPFYLPVIPAGERDNTLEDQMKTTAFREAMLFRLAEHGHLAMAYGNDAPLTKTMAQRLAQLRESETPDWITQCLRTSVIRRGTVEALDGRPHLDSYHARQSILEWCIDNGKGKTPPTAHAVTKALMDLCGKPDAVNTNVCKRTGTGNEGKQGRTKANHWYDWVWD